MHASMEFSTTHVEKLCGKDLFATDKFLKHLDFQQIAHKSGEPSYSFCSAVCIYETQSWREYVGGAESYSHSLIRSHARLCTTFSPLTHEYRVANKQ
jgi:hypothetical protein